MSAHPSHIRPEIKREVDEYLAARAALRRLEQNLRDAFKRRLEAEGLTVSEMAMFIEALERKE